MKVLAIFFAGGLALFDKRGLAQKSKRGLALFDNHNNTVLILQY